MKRTSNRISVEITKWGWVFTSTDGWKTHAEQETKWKIWVFFVFVFIIYFGSYAVIPIDTTLNNSLFCVLVLPNSIPLRIFLHNHEPYSLWLFRAYTNATLNRSQGKNVAHASMLWMFMAKCLGCVCVNKRHIRLQNRTITHAVHKIHVDEIFHVHIRLASGPFDYQTECGLPPRKNADDAADTITQSNGLLSFTTFSLNSTDKTLKCFGCWDSVWPANETTKEPNRKWKWKKEQYLCVSIVLFGHRQFFAFEFGECCGGFFVCLLPSE